MVSCKLECIVSGIAASMECKAHVKGMLIGLYHARPATDVLQVGEGYPVLHYLHGSWLHLHPCKGAVREHVGERQQQGSSTSTKVHNVEPMLPSGSNQVAQHKGKAVNLPSFLLPT